MSTEQKPIAPTKKLRTYRVYVAQVNQACVHVRAADAGEAAEKGYAKWRRNEAHSHVRSVELADEGSSND